MSLKNDISALRAARAFFGDGDPSAEAMDRLILVVNPLGALSEEQIARLRKVLPIGAREKSTIDALNALDEVLKAVRP